MEITVQEIISQISQQLRTVSETALLDAQVLVAHHLDKPRTWVLAHPDIYLDDTQSMKINQAVCRLEQGEPLPYVIGHWEFYGLDLLLSPDVLIPRPETELLVERAIKWLQLHPHKRRVVDIGTGSGCIGVAIARYIPDVCVLMTDISTQALTIARRNAEKQGLLNRLQFQRSQLLDQVPGPFDLICANLPYIPTQILNTLPVAKKEPRIALDGGLNGMKLIKRVLKQAKGSLQPGGLMLVEIDPSQSSQLIAIAQKNYPGSRVQILQDLSGRDRCLEIEFRYTIFHICQRQDWLKHQAGGEYKPDSLAREGFIHCSQSDQIDEVANRYYQLIPDVVVLSIDPAKLTSEIRWEKSGDAYYPHVYGPLNLEAVDSVIGITPGNDGKYQAIRVSTQ